MMTKSEMLLRRLSEMGYDCAFDAKPEWHLASHFRLVCTRLYPTRHKFIVRGVSIDILLTKAVREAEAVEANEIEEGRA